MKERLCQLVAFMAVISCISGCSPAYAEQTKLTPENFDVKEGYYVSDSDESYLFVSDGYIELFNYDIDSVLEEQYRKAIEEGTINQNSLPYEEYYDNSIEFYNETAGRKKYSIKILPNSTAMLVIQSFETGNGGGSYIGYTIIDDDTLLGKGNYYTYSNNEIAE